MSRLPRPARVGIVVFDEVEVLDCCGPFEVFSVANRVVARSGAEPLFDVALVATTAQVTARGGLRLQADHLVADAPSFDLLVVAGGVTGEAEQDAALVGFLAAARPTLAAAVCTGAFLLAQAGVLHRQRVTTHHEDQAELAQRWPGLTVLADRRWVRDGDVLTSGGISAGIDLSLHLVALAAGRDVALATARQMEYRWEQDGAADGAADEGVA